MDEQLRLAVIKLAHEVPETRAHLIPLLRLAAEEEALDEKEAGLSDMWNAYKKKHPGAKKPPPSMVEKSKKPSGEHTDVWGKPYHTQEGVGSWSRNA